MSTYDKVVEGLSEAMQKAANDFLSDAGGIVTGMLGMVAYMDDHGNHCWSIVEMVDQQVATSLGMGRIITMTVDGMADRMIFDDDED